MTTNQPRERAVTCPICRRQPITSHAVCDACHDRYPVVLDLR